MSIPQSLMSLSDIINLVAPNGQRRSSVFIVINFTIDLVKKSRPAKGGWDNDIRC